jgi:hypothetical protein
MSGGSINANRPDTVVATDLASVVVLKGAQSSALPVTITSSTGNTTSTVTRVAANAASVTLLASNTNRKGVSFCNNSNQTLYLKLGTTANIGAGTESFTAILAPKDTNGVGGYYEVPFNYTGRIDGIWAAADANGECLVDEITA